MRGLKHDATAKRLLDGYVTNYNFCRTQSSIGKTPAEAAGIEVKGWKESIRNAQTQRDNRRDSRKGSDGDNGESMRRALITLPDGVWKVVDALKGELGDGDIEVIRNIVISHLTEKGYLLKPKTGGKTGTDQMASELDMHDMMIESLAEVFEEKGAIKYSDWESRIKRKLAGK